MPSDHSHQSHLIVHVLHLNYKVTATLSPPGILENGPLVLLLSPLWNPPLIRRSARE